MSSDTLVIKVSEYGASSSDEISSRSLTSSLYVFYDYKTRFFGVRCGYTKKNGDIGSFSYYVDNEDMVVEFLLEFFHDPLRTTVALVNYSDLPKNSDDITYEYLKENDEDKNEISGYQYNHDFDEEDDEDEEEGGVKDKEEMFPNKEIRRYVKLIQSVYNEY